MKKIIRKRMLCWTAGQKHSCGGPGMHTITYQNNKPYHIIGHCPGRYYILQEV